MHVSRSCLSVFYLFEVSGSIDFSLLFTNRLIKCLTSQKKLMINLLSQIENCLSQALGFSWGLKISKALVTIARAFLFVY